VPSDPSPEAATASPATLAALRAIDAAVLGHGRDADHAFLLAHRPCHLYRRDGRVVGYAYHGPRCGPIALLDEADFPAVLAHAEREAAARGDDFGAEVPLVNRAAVDYLLGRGCRMEPFLTFCLSDAPFGHPERYILTSPTYFL
jgi:hypothetical protein